MTEPAPHPDAKFLAERDSRQAALSKLTERFSALKADLTDMPVSNRLGAYASGKAKSAAAEAVDVARESKGIIAGTVGVLALWALRRPILSQARKIWPRLMAHAAKESDE